MEKVVKKLVRYYCLTCHQVTLAPFGLSEIECSSCGRVNLDTYVALTQIMNRLETGEELSFESDDEPEFTSAGNLGGVPC